ncbi:MAG: transposase [Xanthobacteraceae bacterium]
MANIASKLTLSETISLTKALVDHHRKQYVIGAVHTNTIEGFWSIFKRGVVGTFHKMSAKYMPLYVAEFQFRYNNRFNSDIFGHTISTTASQSKRSPARARISSKIGHRHVS